MFATTTKEKIDFGIIYIGSVLAGMGTIWALTVLLREMMA